MDQTLMMQVGTIDDEMRGKYLTFRIDDGEYGIEIKHITEIIGVQDVTPVPHTHSYVKGLINLRGTVVPVIDVRLRFGLEEIAYTERTCIIVISMEEMVVGLIVDEVQEVSNIGDEQMRPPPKISSKPSNFFIRAVSEVDGSIKQLLDIEKVFGTGAVVETE